MQSMTRYQQKLARLAALSERRRKQVEAIRARAPAEPAVTVQPVTQFQQSVSRAGTTYAEKVARIAELKERYRRLGFEVPEKVLRRVPEEKPAVGKGVLIAAAAGAAFLLLR